VSDDSSASGSRARDHLANERTYLAWLRTAMAVMVIGLGLAQFSRGSRAAAIVAGGLLVVVGAVGVAYGTIRYRRVSVDIDNDRYGTSGRGPIVASIVVVASIVAALLILLLNHN
jgi:putative membrane protein